MQGFDPPSLDRVRDDVDSLRPRLALKRRAFVATSLGAGFAAAVLPVQARTMIVTDAQGLTAGEVRIPTRDGEMPAYRAMPEGKRISAFRSDSAAYQGLLLDELEDDGVVYAVGADLDSAV